MDEALHECSMIIAPTQRPQNVIDSANRHASSDRGNLKHRAKSEQATHHRVPSGRARYLRRDRAHPVRSRFTQSRKRCQRTEQVQNDGLVEAENGAVGDQRSQAVADLSRSARDQDAVQRVRMSPSWTRVGKCA